LYELGTWSLALREGEKLREFESTVQMIVKRKQRLPPTFLPLP
jgi:hypothetical protein